MNDQDRAAVEGRLRSLPAPEAFRQALVDIVNQSTSRGYLARLVAASKSKEWGAPAFSRGNAPDSESAGEGRSVRDVLLGSTPLGRKILRDRAEKKAEE